MKLYKYYPPQSHKFIFKKNGSVSLRVSQPSTLNDPFDLSPSIEIPEKDYIGRAKALNEEVNSKSDYFINASTGEYYKKSNPVEFAQSLKDKDLKDRVNNLKKYNDQNIGVLSLSKDGKNNLMWSHYSEDHKGFIIEIKNEFKIDNIKNELYAQDVKYCSKRPITKLAESYSDKKYFLYKDPIWKYEKEKRLVIELSHIEPTEESKKDILPIHCLQYPRNQLSKIVLGALCPPKIEECICKWAVAHEPFIEVEKAYLNPSSYELEYKPLPARHTSNKPNT